MSFIVNDLIVLFFNQLGLGHTAMKKLSSLFGWESLHLKIFQDKEKHIISKIIDNTNDVLSASMTKVKEAYSALAPFVSTDPLCITVSFDGSWHKRGHASMYGFASMIDVLTGLVVAVFNEGSIQLSQVMERLAIETNQIHNLLMDEMDRKRMYKANIASSSRARKERADRWVKQRPHLATQEA